MHEADFLQWHIIRWRVDTIIWTERKIFEQYLILFYLFIFHLFYSFFSYSFIFYFLLLLSSSSSSSSSSLLLLLLLSLSLLLLLFFWGGWVGGGGWYLIQSEEDISVIINGLTWSLSSQLKPSLTNWPSYVALLTNSNFVLSRFIENWSSFKDCSWALLSIVLTADVFLLTVNLYM